VEKEAFDLETSFMKYREQRNVILHKALFFTAFSVITQARFLFNSQAKSGAKFLKASKMGIKYISTHWLEGKNLIKRKYFIYPKGEL